MAGPTKPRLGRKMLESKVINKEPLKIAHDEEVNDSMLLVYRLLMVS